MLIETSPIVTRPTIGAVLRHEGFTNQGSYPAMPTHPPLEEAFH
jgi:hypothetical protein